MASTNPWDIVEYEAKMLFGLCQLLGEAFKSGNDLVDNALVESICLHMRIFVDILLSKKSDKDDDIRLEDLMPGFQHPSVNQLRAVYKDGRTEGSPCWVLNKMVAHPTLKRGASYDYTSIIRQLLPLIEGVWQEIEKHRQRALSSFPRPSSGGVVPQNMCAKTSS
jgi:hypothetical protein